MLVYQRVVEGFLKPPLTGFYDDRWYTKPAQTYFYQKGIIGFHQENWYLDPPTTNKMCVSCHHFNFWDNLDVFGGSM